jgi:hypothetical protein
MSNRKYSCIIVLLSYLCCGCNNSNQNINLQKEVIQHSSQAPIQDTADSNTPSITDTTQQSESKTGNNKRENIAFLKDYEKSLILDTSFHQDGSLIKIKHEVLSDYYILPTDLNFSKDRTKIIMRTRTLIEIDDTKFIIAADSFKRLIPYNPYVAKYGILLDPEIQVKTDSMVISFNYSIPYTDLGYLVSASIHYNKPRITFNY